jgi:hypothetical protein
MMSVQWWTCWLMLATATRADVGERLTMAVSPWQSFAPATLTVRVHIRAVRAVRGSTSVWLGAGSERRIRRA